MSRVRLTIQSLIPWVLFFALDNYGNIELNIAIVGALAYIIIFNNKALQHGFLLDWASLIFFFFMVIMVFVFHHIWYVLNAPLLAYYTLATVTWFSIIIGHPLTMQYSRLAVTKELWTSKLFYRENNILTIFWALILSTVALLSTTQKFIWGGTLWLSELLPTALFLLGIWFTFWFPEWYKRTIIGEWGVISIKNLSGLHISHASIANIAFRTLGRGQKLILLPPSRMNMLGWDPELLRRLAKRFQVIIIDYPDIGESKLKRGDYTVNNIADAIAQFIENINDGKVAILGYALGGWIAQEVAIRYPQLIDKLALIATDVGSPRTTLADKKIRKTLLTHTTAADADNEQFMQLLLPAKAMRSALPRVRAIFIAANFKESLSSSVVLLQQHMAEQWYCGPGTYQQLGNIDANTVIISGAQDKIVNRQNSMLLVNGIRGAKFIEYPDAGHGVIYQHPDDIAELINAL